MDDVLSDEASTEQVRVRFLNNLGRDYYVQLAPLASCREPESPSAPEETMAREREIFLKATLQLLDQQDNLHIRHRSAAHHGSQKNGGKEHAHSGPHSASNGRSSQQSTHTHQQQQQQDDNTRYDVIRLGFLKKARGGAFASSSSSSVAWKTKYVELRHGLFTYDDHAGSSHALRLADLTSSDQSNLATRRSISLSAAEQTVCREYEPALFDGCAFEILSQSNARRVWLTNSAEECAQWVLAIRSAILGAVWEDSLSVSLALSLSLLQNLHTADHDHSLSAQSDLHSDSFSRLEESTTSQSKEREREKDNGVRRTLSLDVVDRETHTHSAGGSRQCTWLSIDGAAAPYAKDMSSFLFLQGLFNAPQIAEHDYRSLLREMALRGFEMSIPVLFIKSKTTHSNFVLSPQDSLSTQNVSAKCTSQVWKDLQRDLILVNGDLVSGERGAEAMVGALVRHICDKADEIKSSQDKLLRSRRADARNGAFDSHKIANNKPFASAAAAAAAVARTKLFSPSSSSAAAQALLLQEEAESKTPFAVPFSASEAQIVQCARDLLVLCNRTQSGGDTYFCVDALLCADKQRALSILTPFSPEAEPLHFCVDVVSIHQFQTHSAMSFSPSRRRGSSTSCKESNTNTSAALGSRSHHMTQLDVPAILRERERDEERYIGLAIDECDSVKLFTAQTHTTNATRAAEKERENMRPPPKVPAMSAAERDREREGGKDKDAHSMSSSLAQRRPQLDLISALERDGFLLGVAHRGKALVLEDEGDSQEEKETATPRHIAVSESASMSRPNSGGNHTKEAQTVPLFLPSPSSSAPAIAHAHGYSRSSNIQTHSHRESVPDQVIVVDGKDDLSVISELTWDTQHRAAPNAKLFPTSRSPAHHTYNAQSTHARHNQQSGIDDEAEGDAEKEREEEDADEQATDVSSVSGKKKKSIFKKIGHKLQKPFRKENFEAITSPFKPMRSRGNERERESFAGAEPPRMRNNSEPPLAVCVTPPRESDALRIEDGEESNRSCIRVQVTAHSKYRVCNANPTGVEALDSWATVSGVFSQSFFIVGDGSGLLGIADRLVTIRVDEASAPP